MSQWHQWSTHLLWRSGLAALLRRILTYQGRFVLEFHGLLPHTMSRPHRVTHPGLTNRELEAILAWVGRRFTFLTPQAFLYGEKPGVLLTFDDGLANTVTYGLSLLEQFQAPAIFFVTTQHVHNPYDWLPASRKLARQLWPDEQYDAVAHTWFDGMSETQLAACGRHPLLTIGGHTLSHPFLTKCDNNKLRHELEASRQYLVSITGQPVDLFAYPTGDYDRRVAEAVRAAGYQAAFAERLRGIGLPAYEIPRVGIYQANAAYLSVKLSGLHQPALRAVYV